MFLPGPLTKHHAAPLLVRRDDIADMLLGVGLREAVEAVEFTISGHNFLRYVAGGKCECDPEVGASPCITCAAAAILSKNEKALIALEGKLAYNAADDPEIRAALQRTVNGD